MRFSTAVLMGAAVTLQGLPMELARHGELNQGPKCCLCVKAEETCMAGMDDAGKSGFSGGWSRKSCKTICSNRGAVSAKKQEGPIKKNEVCGPDSFPQTKVMCNAGTGQAQIHPQAGMDPLPIPGTGQAQIHPHAGLVLDPPPPLLVEWNRESREIRREAGNSGDEIPLPYACPTPEEVWKKIYDSDLEKKFTGLELEPYQKVLDNLWAIIYSAEGDFSQEPNNLWAIIYSVEGGFFQGAREYVASIPDKCFLNSKSDTLRPLVTGGLLFSVAYGNFVVREIQFRILFDDAEQNPKKKQIANKQLVKALAQFNAVGAVGAVHPKLE